MSRFEGKKALVTGASRGIGECVALRFAAEGASLYLAADGTQDELENVARECEAAGGRAAIGVYDLAVEGAAERMVEAAVGRYGRRRRSREQRRNSCKPTIRDIFVCGFWPRGRRESARSFFREPGGAAPHA